MQRFHHRFSLPALFLALLLTSCSDDPANPATGFTANGVELQGSNSLMITASGTTLTGDTVRLNVGDSILYTAQFITADGSRGLPTESAYTLVVTVADPSIATATVSNRWSVTVRGVATGGGRTTMTVALLKGGTAIYTSPVIPIIVTGETAGVAVGDTLEYAAQERDFNNAPDPSTATTQRWIVLATDLTYEGKSGVTLFDRLTLDATQSVTAHDSVYMQMAEDGSIHLFDEMRKQFQRQGGVAAQLGASLPSLWVKVADTRTTTATTWNSLGTDSVVMQNVQIPGSPFPADVVLRGRASHRGAAAQTVPAGSYGDATHTDHTLFLKVTVFGQVALNDSLLGHYDASQRIGLLAWTYDTRELAVGSNSETFFGQEAELVAVRRKR